MDELHGIVPRYEMRTGKEDIGLKEEAFKGSKKTKRHQVHGYKTHESNVEEAQFVRKLKRGSCKYNRKIPFKCFNCGRIG